MNIFLVLNDNSTLPDRFTDILSNHEIVLYKASTFVKASGFFNAANCDIRNKLIQKADIFFLEFSLVERKNTQMHRIFDKIIELKWSGPKIASINEYKKRTLEETLIEFANYILEENGEIRCIYHFMRSFSVININGKKDSYSAKKQYDISKIVLLSLCFISLGSNLTSPLISHEHGYIVFIDIFLLILTLIYSYILYKTEYFYKQRSNKFDLMIKERLENESSLP